MSFETKDPGRKEQLARTSLNNVIEDTYTDSCKSRRSQAPQTVLSRQPLPSGKSTHCLKEPRESSCRINQYLPERQHSSTVYGGSGLPQNARLTGSRRDQLSCPQTPELSARNINQKDLYMTPNSSRQEKPARQHSRWDKQDFTSICDPDLVKLILSSVVDQLYPKASKQGPGWREQTRNIFQTSVCSLTASKVSSNGHSKIEYIEDFAASNHEPSEMQMHSKNQPPFNIHPDGHGSASCPCDEYALMGKFPAKCEDEDDDHEVLETTDKNPYHDTPDLKVTQTQKSSIQTVPSALEEFVHGMENQRQQSTLVEKLRDSQESRKETLTDSGKVKMFSTKLNPQNRILNQQQRRIGRMSPPLPCQSYGQGQEIMGRGPRNKTVERHIVDMNQRINQSGTGAVAAPSYHVVGDNIENKTLKMLPLGSGQTYSIYNSQRERSKESFRSLLSKGSRVKTHSNSAVEVSARDGHHVCFPPVVDEEELMNLRDLCYCGQISGEGHPLTARSQTLQRTLTREQEANEAEEIEAQSQNVDNLAGADGSSVQAGAPDTTDPTKNQLLEKHLFPRIDLEEENASEEEIASEEDDSECQREKERQEETRRMIEQAKLNRRKCIDDSSSSSDLQQDAHSEGDESDVFRNFAPPPTSDHPIQIEDAEGEFADFRDDLLQGGCLVDCQRAEQPKGKDNVHQNYLDADVDDQLAIEPLKSSINLQKIIMENNKNTQRWDLPNFSDHSSNESDEGQQHFARMLIVEEEDDAIMGSEAQQRLDVRHYDEEEHEVLDFEHSDDEEADCLAQSRQGGDREAESHEVKRAPTPINQFSASHHDKEVHLQRLEGVKTYLKTDSQFESVPEEIEAENREESDVDGSTQSPINCDQQESLDCTEKSNHEIEFEDAQNSSRDDHARSRQDAQRDSPEFVLEEVHLNHHSRTGQNMDEEESDDFQINNVSLEVLTSRIKQRNQELLENSQVSSNHMKPDLDRSYSSCNSALRRREDSKKPAPLQFDDIETEENICFGYLKTHHCNDDNLNPMISFQAEDQSQGKTDPAEAYGASEQRPKQKSRRVYLKDQTGGRNTMFNPPAETALEGRPVGDTKGQRKSMDFGSSRKIINSASRVKAPTPSSKLEKMGGSDELFLNKSMEIKKRSRNKNSKAAAFTHSRTQVPKKRQSLLTKKGDGGPIEVSALRKPPLAGSSSDAAQAAQSQRPSLSAVSGKESGSSQPTTLAGKLFFKPFSSTNGGTSSGRQRYSSCQHTHPLETGEQKPKVDKKLGAQSRNLKGLAGNYGSIKVAVSSPKIIDDSSGARNEDRKALKLGELRTGVGSNKMKSDMSPNNYKTSVLSGLSVISQLSFIKQSFASPTANAEAQTARQKTQELQAVTPVEIQKSPSRECEGKPERCLESEVKAITAEEISRQIAAAEGNAEASAAHQSQPQTKQKLASKPGGGQIPLQKKKSSDGAVGNTKRQQGRLSGTLFGQTASKTKQPRPSEGVLKKHPSQKSLTQDARNSSLLQASSNRSETSNDSDLVGAFQHNQSAQPAHQRRSLPSIMGFGQKKKLFK